MEMVRQVLATAAVLVALGAVMLLLRRNGRGGWGALRRRKASRLEAIERVPLSPHHALHLVRFGDRALLIAAHSGGCTLLESAAWPAVDAGAPHLEEPLG
jgi:flagellar biogenesis protein FliO